MIRRMVQKNEQRVKGIWWIEGWREYIIGFSVQRRERLEKRGVLRIYDSNDSITSK